MKAKVLYITHYGDLYGANLSMLHLITTLKEHYNIQPLVLASRKGKLLEKLKEHHIDYIYFPFPSAVISKEHKYLFIIKLIKNIIKYPCYIMAFIKLDFGKNLDIIHTNSSVCDIGYYNDLSEY